MPKTDMIHSGSFNPPRNDGIVAKDRECDPRLIIKHCTFGCD
jgi:hypothetical protein